jgi:hypothetical protein
VELQKNENVQPKRISIIGGTHDGEQLTLVFRDLLFAENVAGTVRWNSIRLHGVGPNGDVLSFDFKRSSFADFKAYADELRLRAEAGRLSAHLFARASEFRSTVKRTEHWVADADLQPQRISRAKDSYRKLEDLMRSLIERERATSNPVARRQIFVSVSQADVAGAQADSQAEEVWEGRIGSVGQALRSEFAPFPSDCGIRKDLQKRGATAASIDAWETACRQMQAERAKFHSTLKRTMEQRVELKTFQTTAESHLRALIAEARRIL